MDSKLIKQFGDLAFITGDQLTLAGEVVSVSPRLDIILGGGIPGGSFVNISGDPKCGKTITSLCIVKNAQKQGRPCYYFNIEGRLKRRDLHGIRGLDIEKLQIIRSYRGEDGKARILTAEEYLQIANHIIETVPGCVIVFDSVSQLAAEKELLGEIGDSHRAPGAVLMAQFCRNVSNTVPVNDCIVVSIIHLISNTSGFGASKVESGGRKVKYACDIGLRAKKFDFKGDPPHGQEVVWQTFSAALTSPGRSITSHIRYGIGIDDALEIALIACDCGLIDKPAKGSWYTLSYLGGKKPKKVQGEEKLCSFLQENPEAFEKLSKEVKEILFNDRA
jgi:RecA/RadA recombinase